MCSLYSIFVYFPPAWLSILESLLFCIYYFLSLPPTLAFFLFRIRIYYSLCFYSCILSTPHSHIYFHSLLSIPLFYLFPILILLLSLWVSFPSPPYSSYSVILSFSPFPPFHPSILFLPHSSISFLPLSPSHSRIFPSLFTPPSVCSSCYSPACLNNPFESSLLRGSISVSLVSFVFPSQHPLVYFRPVLSSPARIPIT